MADVNNEWMARWFPERYPGVVLGPIGALEKPYEPPFQEGPTAEQIASSDGTGNAANNANPESNAATAQGTIGGISGLVDGSGRGLGTMAGSLGANALGMSGPVGAVAGFAGGVLGNALETGNFSVSGKGVGQLGGSLLGGLVAGPPGALLGGFLGGKIGGSFDPANPMDAFGGFNTQAGYGAYGNAGPLDAGFSALGSSLGPGSMLDGIGTTLDSPTLGIETDRSLNMGAFGNYRDPGVAPPSGYVAGTFDMSDPGTGYSAGTGNPANAGVSPDSYDAASALDGGLGQASGTAGTSAGVGGGAGAGGTSGAGASAEGGGQAGASGTSGESDNRNGGRIGYARGGALGYARGGQVPQGALGGVVRPGDTIRAGSYVLPAYYQTALGRGSSQAGALKMMKEGGRVVQGPGDGRSDSVLVRGPRGALRLSRDEVVLEPEAVRVQGGAGALDRKVNAARKSFQGALAGYPGPRQ